MKKRIVIFFAAMAFLGVLSFAQESTGEILGKALLADGAALPGVSVTLTGETYGKNVLVTSEEGNYRFPKLSPGNYSLRFELEGFKSVIRKDFRLSVGQNLAMNAVMEPGTIQEEITVLGVAPMINTRKANVSLNMSSSTVDLLPVARRATEVIAMAPGITSPEPTYGGQGSGVINGFGSRNIGSEFNVDGASFNSTYGAGGMPAGVNMARVEETQVTTSNQDITNVQGGVTVNFVSKRAGNKVSGDFYLDMMDHSMQSTKSLPDYMKNPISAGGLGYKTNSGIYRLYEYGATLGFPVWKDHLWFFGSWGIGDSVTRNLAGVSADRYYSPDYYAKVNAQWGKTSAEFSFNKTDSTAKNVDFSSSIVTVNKLDRANPTNTYTGQISTTLWDTLLLSAKATYFHKSTATNQANTVWTGAGDVTYDEGRTYNPVNRYYTYNFFKTVPYNTEATGYWQRYGYQEKRPYVIAEANYFAEKFLGGDHEFKIGFDLNYSRYIEEYMAPNQMFVHAYPWSQFSSTLGNAPMKNGKPDAYWSRFQTYNDRYGEYRAERQGIFVSDIVTYGRLTMNLGIRFDHHNWVWEPANYHGLAPADKPITAWDNWTGPLTVAGGKANIGWAISPRFSAAYDIFGTGKDVVKFSFANYGGALQAGISAPLSLGLQTMGGLKSGYTRGEFMLPYNDLNGDFVPSIEELNLPFDPQKQQYGFPTPTALLNMIAVGQAEQKAWLAANPGKTDIPWTAYTYPGWHLMSFSGPIQGKATAANLPTVLLKDKNGTYSGFTPTRLLEITAGYEKQLTNDIKVGAMYAYKKEYNFPRGVGFWGNINNYTLIPVETTFLAGKDPATGWEIWQGKPVTQLPAANGTVYTNYKKYYQYFNGLQFSINKKLSNKWMANASLDLQSWKQHKDQSEFPGTTLWDYYQDNYVAGGQFLSTEPTGQNARWHIKFNGLYQLPWGMTVSAILDAREGYMLFEYVGTYLNNLLPPAGSKFGDFRLPMMWYLNLAIEKTFVLTEGSQVTLHLTGFNITDNMITTRVNQTATKLPTAIQWMTGVQPGRIFQVGIRYSFR